MAFIGNIEQFNSKETEISSYIERLEQLFMCNDISTDAKKVSLLIALIGGEAYGVLKDLVAPALPSEKKYVELVEELKKHYSPMRLIIAERYRFHTAHQEQHEDIRSFVARLKNLAKFCDFSTFLDDSLRDRLVCGLKSESIKRRLLTEESLTFEKAYTTAIGMELAEEQLKVMGPEVLVTSSTHKTMSGGESNFQLSHSHGPKKQKSSRIHGNNILVSYDPPEKEPEFAATDDGDGDSDDGGGASDDCACKVDIDPDGCYDHVAPQEESESKAIDVYYHPLKDDPEPGDGDGDTVVVNGCYDRDPLERELEPQLATTGTSVDADVSYCDDDPSKDEPELVLVATSDVTDNDSYKCSHCGISLSTRAFRVEHNLRCELLVKQDELESQVAKLYHCCYCGCPFVNKEYKVQHQRNWCRKKRVIRRRGFNGTRFKCDKCKFVTKWKHHLENHLFTHNKSSSSAKQLTCTQCSYKTVRRSYMNKHMRVHSNNFRCLCPICGRCFRMKRCLDDHILRQHFDRWEEFSKLITYRIYTCNICDKFKTTVKPALAKHALTHVKGVGSQKYECPRCSYSAFSKGNLRNHVRKHENYQCAACARWFSRKTYLDSHILHNHASNVDLVKTVTSKIHRCESCSFKTGVVTNLKRHVQSNHKSCKRSCE